MVNSESQPSITSLRNTLRRDFRLRRNNMTRQEQNSSAIKLLAKLKSCTWLNEAKKVALYMTNDGELDTQALITHYWQQDARIYLPVLHPFAHGHLLFLEYTEATPMRANHYGILEPQLDCSKICPAAQLDVLFTPLVAFDEDGNRLGMGGGFYDRTLLGLSNNSTTQTKIVGLAHEHQKTQDLPKQAWDIPLPYILTPSKLYSCHQKGKQSE